FHWLIAALILSQIALGLTAAGWHLSPTKLNLFVWHKSIGMLILALVVLRLLWRLGNPAPALPAGMSALERRAAQASHFLLYAVAIAMPLTGWVINSAAKVPFQIFWTVPLPAIVSPDKGTADAAALAHFSLFVLLAAVLIAHISAALRHHFVKHDDVLLRMLPETRRKK
ncbi:MAG TPA: cytochrome b, partial [Burkholderiales bacterium]|nr:cytochrome b [Burkholderiales bacterium]